MSPRQPRKNKPRAKPRARPRESARDRLSLLHEVRVYQEELQTQNEELMRAHLALEESRERFVELYDFAPSGYLILDLNGVILQANLVAAHLLGRPRDQIERTPFMTFVTPESRTRYSDFLRLCRVAMQEQPQPQPQPQPQISVDVTLQLKDGPRDVQIACRPSFSSGVKRELLAGLLDITERQRANREHAALASRLLSAQDEERQRIARDLHDHVGQQVTALRLILQVAQMSAASDETRARLKQADSIVEQLDRQLDFMTGELRPASLDLGITSAIEQFVRGWSATFSISADFQCRGMDAVHFDRDVETHIYRVMQEALNNAYKHAKARHVRVVLERKDGEAVLTVEDNGRGFDASPQSQERPRGLGLLSMRERAELGGGRLEIQTAPLKGTTVCLRLPIAGRKESR